MSWICGVVYAKQSNFFQIGGDGDTFKDLNASHIAVSNASFTFFCNKKWIQIRMRLISTQVGWPTVNPVSKSDLSLTLVLDEVSIYLAPIDAA